MTDNPLSLSLIEKIRKHAGRPSNRWADYVSIATAEEVIREHQSAQGDDKPLIQLLSDLAQSNDLHITYDEGLFDTQGNRLGHGTLIVRSGKAHIAAINISDHPIEIESGGIKWLCRPNQPPLNMDAVVPNGILSREEDTRPAPPKVDPDMSSQQLKLHMGEMTAQEERTARAALRWANSITGGDMTFTNSSCVKQKAMGDLQVQKADDLPPPTNIDDLIDSCENTQELADKIEKQREIRYTIGRDPSCFGNVYCDGKLIARSSHTGIPDGLTALVDAANATRKPAIESALENAAEILANFKGEPTATKLEQWQACYAMLFKQMNDLVATRKPVSPYMDYTWEDIAMLVQENRVLKEVASKPVSIVDCARAAHKAKYGVDVFTDEDIGAAKAVLNAAGVEYAD